MAGEEALSGSGATRQDRIVTGAASGQATLHRARSLWSPAAHAASAASAPSRWRARAPTSSFSTVARSRRRRSTRAPLPTTSRRTQEEIQALGRHALTIQADVTKEAELRVAVSEALGRLGRIDILVCSAGIFTWGRLWELTEEQWDETIDVNLKGVWLTLKTVVPHMIERRYGRIVVLELDGRPARVGRGLALRRLEARRDRPRAQLGAGGR